KLECCRLEACVGYLCGGSRAYAPCGNRVRASAFALGCVELRCKDGLASCGRACPSLLLPGGGKKGFMSSSETSEMRPRITSRFCAGDRRSIGRQRTRPAHTHPELRPASPR